MILFRGARQPGPRYDFFREARAGRGRDMIFISPAGGWAGLDGEGFLKDLALGRPSAGPAGRPAKAVRIFFCRPARLEGGIIVIWRGWPELGGGIVFSPAK